tara:strand:+ start:2427 stop:3098 length:672 start_codon:yes stop_codon:yes gene_type:complete
MQDSMSELKRLRWRTKFYSPFIALGIIGVAFAIIMGLGKDDPLSFDSHFYVLIGGVSFVLLGMILYQNEEEFAQKYDMTHILDLDDKEERYNAYLEHLSDWINSDIEEINPVRARGSDPLGPDWGKTDFKLGHEPVRRDAVVEGKKYSGMEGDLTAGEKMVADANQKYATMAQKRWEIAESNDPDLIEYGVDKLGDLVRTDYFEKNAEDGVFDKVANPDSETQ